MSHNEQQSKPIQSYYLKTEVNENNIPINNKKKTPERPVHKTYQNYNLLLQNEPKDIRKII